MADVVVVFDDPVLLVDKTSTVDRGAELDDYLAAFCLPARSTLCVTSWRQGRRKTDDVFDRATCDRRLWETLYGVQPTLIVPCGIQASWAMLGQRDLAGLWGLPWAVDTCVVLPLPLELLRHAPEFTDQVEAGFEAWQAWQAGEIMPLPLPPPA